METDQQTAIDIEFLIGVSRKAGKKILEIYNSDFEVESKDDKSPLTEADKRANDLILAELQDRYPEIPFISEETKTIAYETRKTWDRFWLIDPLDGTKEFIKRNGEFTVNIALVQNGKPVIGVVHIPVKDETYFASEGDGSYKIEGENAAVKIENKTHFSRLEKIIVVASRSHLSPEVIDFVEELKSQGKEVDFVSAGSSLKFCLLAEGKANVYPRFGPTMEWDTGAAHIIATEAGKKVINHETKQALKYNKENLLNPWFIVE